MIIELNGYDYHLIGKTALICYEHLTVYQVLTEEGIYLYFAFPENYIILQNCGCNDMWGSFDFDYLVSCFEDKGRYEYSKYFYFIGD